MRKRLLGTAALLTASHLSAAEPPQLPQAAPPAPLTLPADSALALPPVSAVQPLPPNTTQPPTGAGQAPTPGQTPPAQGSTSAQPPAGNSAQAGQSAQAANTFRDCHTGPPEWMWAGISPLAAWIKHGPLPTLAVAGNGQVLGGDSVDYGTYKGLALDSGFWLDCRHVWGVSFGGFLLEQRSAFGSLASDATGNPAIVRPFTDALTATPAAFPVAAPAGTVGVAGSGMAGSVAFATSSRLWGAEAGIVRNVYYTQDYTVDVGFGFRYLDLEESLTVDQASTAFGAGVFRVGGANGVGATSVFVEDRFHTRNQFYGGQFMTRAEYRFGAAFLNVVSKVALGPNHEVVSIAGSTTGGGVTVPGGLLAVAGTPVPGIPMPGGNIGRDVTNRFVVMPELGADLGVQLSCHVRVSLGYHLLYINDTVRPGSQIDSVINPRLVPLSGQFNPASTSGGSSPRLTGQRDEFYAHGVLFRLETCW